MKKLFLAMAAIAALAFIGCSKDEGGVPPSTENIAGTWELYKDYQESDGEKYVDTEWGVEYGDRILRKFNTDNTFEHIEMYEYNDGQWRTSSESGTFQISGNKLQLTWSPGVVDEWIIEKLTASELILFNDDYGIDRDYFRRIE